MASLFRIISPVISRNCLLEIRKINITTENRNADEHTKVYETILKASKGSQTFYKAECVYVCVGCCCFCVCVCAFVCVGDGVGGRVRDRMRLLN